jgi:hypothetical protein
MENNIPLIFLLQMNTMELDLVTVRDFLFDVRLKWYDIGMELMVKEGELDIIQSRNKDDFEVCLREMLKVRLKSFRNGPLTWKNIAEALEKKAISELQLASEGICPH